jgi:LmbE family N-acetylglucosaminyl deacetylase
MGAEVSTVRKVSVAVLSPHLDDAVLSAWSVLRRPGPVTVVNVCAGVPPPGPPARWDRFTGARDAAERMRERLAEDRVALARAGREAVQLNFMDNQYRAGPIDAAALEQAIADAIGDAAELWAPAGVGAHPDHVQVREAALALRGEGGPPVRLYADVPYVLRSGWPEGSEPHVLSRVEVWRKLRALRDYRTQWPGFVTWTDGAIRRSRVMRREASYAAAPAVSTPAPSTRAP